MKVHRTILLTAATASAAKFAAGLRRLCRQMPGWKFLAGKSNGYTRDAGRPSYLVAFEGETALPAAAVALTLKGGKSRLHFYSPNIIPAQTGQLSPEEYNGLAVRFVADLKRAPGYRSSGIAAKVTDERIGLDEVVSGKECRRFFLNYLHGYPLTFHGSDIYNLDRFICAVDRFQCKVSPDDLARYLVEDRGWEARDANWVRDRVRAGLEILAVNRRF